MEPSIYTHELTGWLHSRADRHGYCDEWLKETEDMGGKPEGLISILQGGMATEQQEVLDSVLTSLEMLAGNVEEAA